MYGQGGHKLEINIPPQQICANSKGGLIIEGGVCRVSTVYTYLATLSATIIGPEFDKVCTQFEEKPPVHLPR